MKNYVQNAIENTKKIIPEYWNNTVAQRSATNGAGSVYNASPEEIEKAIYNADWKETSHPSVMEGCRVFKANIGLKGYFGLIEVQKNQTYITDDRKGTGKISLTIKGQRGKQTNETYLIIGEEQGIQVVFTFHPGEPIQPSKVETKNFPHGSTMDGKTALELGFKWAKIV